MKKISFIFQLFLVSIFLKGCFFASMFDLKPKIDLAKNQWKIASFTLGETTYEPQEYEEEPKVRFDTKEFKLYGNTGCNAFFANYSWVDEKKIEMRNSGLTRKMCGPDAMKFEQKLMEEFDGEFEVIEDKDELKLKKENLQINLVPLQETGKNIQSDSHSNSQQENQAKQTGSQLEQNLSSLQENQKQENQNQIENSPSTTQE